VQTDARLAGFVTRPNNFVTLPSHRLF
jgi:hypothetical protein